MSSYGKWRKARHSGNADMMVMPEEEVDGVERFFSPSAEGVLVPWYFLGGGYGYGGSLGVVTGAREVDVWISISEGYGLRAKRMIKRIEKALSTNS